MDEPAANSPLMLVRLGTLIALLAVAAVIILVLGTDGVIGLLEATGTSRWGPPAFVAAFVVAIVMIVPGTLGTITASVLFGPKVGFAAAMAGLIIGSSASFWTARLLGAEGIRWLLGTRMAKVDRLVGRNDFLTIFILRLMPIVPFNGLNYAAGLAPIRYSRYLPATVLGVAPGAALVVFATDELSGGLRLGPATLGLAAMMLVSVFVARRFTTSETA